MDIASIVLVIITLILWVAIFTEKIVRPLYKDYFHGSLLWPDDELERKKLKKFIQGFGLYYFASVLLLLFSPMVGILMGSVGIVLALISYFWMAASKKE